MRGLFITGTDTDVGKTFVTGLVAQSCEVTEYASVFKLACSGAELVDGQPV